MCISNLGLYRLLFPSVGLIECHVEQNQMEIKRVDKEQNGKWENSGIVFFPCQFFAVGSIGDG